jgi:hypothetical protein
MYKVTLYVPGVAIFRLHKMDAIPGIKFDHSRNAFSTMTKAAANKETIIKLSKFLSRWPEDRWAKRIESSSIDLYTNDKEMYNLLLTEFEDLVKNCYEPDETIKTLLENTGSVIVKKLPHNKYHYKAFLLPHKIKSREERQDYIDWLATQGDRVLISEVVKDWFIKTEWNWDRRYIFVEDSQTLLMIKLRNAEAIGRIYDYIIIDK